MRVSFTPQAEKDLAGIPRLREQVKRRARELGQPGAAEQLGKPLIGPLMGYRRVQVHGDHRLVYKVDTENDRVIIVALAHRKWIYTTMEKRLSRGNA